ncbi:hypothetical protein HZA73_06130 [candidate division TA06 bacterium]|nr:hypothetical protein [candidate division TA06 bacterium]
MKNDNDIKNQDLAAQKLLQLAGNWEVEMPEDRFFTNLPVVVAESLRAKPVSWWQKGWICWGTLSGAMTAVMLLFVWQLGTGINANNNLDKAASEWGIDNYGWERVDEVLSQAGQSAELSSSLKDYNSAILLDYSISDQDDYQSATQDLSDEEWKDVLEQISAKERTI